MNNQNHLGQRFKDRVTGFIGIATKREESIPGRVNYTLIGEYSENMQSYAELQMPEEMLEYVDDGVYEAKDVPDAFQF